MLKYFLVALFSLSSYLAALEGSPPKAKINSLTRAFYDRARNRPLVTTLWFPEPFVKGKLYPLVVFSHDSCGSRLELAWMAEYFAENGYIAASVDHYGDCQYLKLPENKESLWDRPQDLTQVMLALTTDTQFGPHFKQDKAIIVGYSTGALAALWLAGARAFKYPQKEGTLSYKDYRVRAIILLAPGFGSYFDKDGLSLVKIPTLIVGAEDDTLYPLPKNAMFFAKFISGAQYVKIGGAPHDFLLCPSRVQKNKIIDVLSPFLLKNLN